MTPRRSERGHGAVSLLELLLVVALILWPGVIGAACTVLLGLRWGGRGLTAGAVLTVVLFVVWAFASRWL